MTSGMKPTRLSAPNDLGKFGDWRLGERLVLEILIEFVCIMSPCVPNFIWMTHSKDGITSRAASGHVRIERAYVLVQFAIPSSLHLALDQLYKPFAMSTFSGGAYNCASELDHWKG